MSSIKKIVKRVPICAAFFRWYKSKEGNIKGEINKAAEFYSKTYSVDKTVLIKEGPRIASAIETPTFLNIELIAKTKAEYAKTKTLCPNNNPR